MNVFEVIGKGRDTGRTRKRKYTVANEDEARRSAEADGTVVESVTDLGPEPFYPPSDAQLKFAADLGIWVPDGSSSQEVSLLISKALAAPERELALAREFGIDPPQYITSDDLRGLILNRLGLEDLTRLYLYLVFIRRASKRASKNVRSPNDPALRALAADLKEDRKFSNSLSNNSFDLDGIEPNQTNAYKAAVDALSPLLMISTSPSSSKRASRQRQAKPGSTAKSGSGSGKTGKAQVPVSWYVVAAIIFALFVIWSL